MLTQLTTPIPLQTPKGIAWAVAVIDYGPQWDLLWVTFIHSSGECWTFHNKNVRLEENYTFGVAASHIAPHTNGKNGISKPLHPADKEAFSPLTLQA